MKRESYRRAVLVVFIVAVIIQASIYLLLMLGINPFRRADAPATHSSLQVPALAASATPAEAPGA